MLFVFLIIELYVLVPAVIAQIFNPTTELTILWEYELEKEKHKLKKKQ